MSANRQLEPRSGPADQRATDWALDGDDEDETRKDRLRLAGDLRDAISAGELTVAYQPIVATDGYVHCVEALARWHHPERGMVPPDQFIPLAEETGLIESLTSHILSHATQQAAAWASHDLPALIAVNLSATLLGLPGLADCISSALREAGLPPTSLTLEVTESALAKGDSASIRSTLDTLHSTGIRISIDDFGTGYSSLAYLKHLPADELKIDRSFIQDLHADERSVRIVQSIIHLAHGLGLAVVAEGVEDLRVVSLLRDIGCDYVQGFGIARPMPADAIEIWLAAHQSGQAIPTSSPIANLVAAIDPVNNAEPEKHSAKPGRRATRSWLSAPESFKPDREQPRRAKHRDWSLLSESGIAAAYSPSVKAGSMSLLWFVGGLVSLLACVLSHPSELVVPVVVSVGVVANLVAAGLWLTRNHLPLWAIPLTAACGTGVITVLMQVGSGGNGAAAATFSFFYMWVVLYSLLFFTPLMAAVETSAVVVAYGWAYLRLGALSAMDPVILGGVIATSGVIVAALSRARDRSEVDPLTGVFNRRGLDRSLELAMAGARDEVSSLIVAIIDLDHFKQINDTQGHQAGDRLLEHVTRAWRATLRSGDVLARFGGDEFVVILPRCGPEESVIILDRLRLASGTAATCSVGAAAWHPGDTLSMLLARADGALYEAKRLGRNRTVTRASTRWLS